MASGKKFSVWYWVMTVAVTVALLAPAALASNGLFGELEGTADDMDFNVLNTFEQCFDTDEAIW